MIIDLKPEIKCPDVILYSDIVYSNPFSNFMQETIPLKLHLLRPFHEIDKWEKLPLLVWVGGGAFRSSTPARQIPELVEIARHGYVVASIRYRVSSEALFPAQIQDVKAAIRFLKAHAGQYGIDPERVAVAGDSAGGHLAALAGTSGGVKEFETDEWNTVTSDVKAVVSWYGGGLFMDDVDDVAKGDPISPLRLLMGVHEEPDPKEMAKLAPASYVSADTPPFQIFHGTFDPVVPIGLSEAFYRVLKDNGVEADFYRIEGAGHATVEFYQPQVQELMIEFLDRHLKK